MRDEFLSELDLAQVRDLADLNARLWAWLETLYHRRAHSALGGLTPLERWQQDLLQVRPLGPLAARLDALFYHRVLRKVRRDATVSFEGRRFEVPYELAGRTVVLVVDPHAEQALAVESKDGQPLGAVTPLDALANAYRKRRQPPAAERSAASQAVGLNAVELAYRQYTQALGDTPSSEEDSP